DYVDRVLNRKDEKYWIDYFYKLTAKELLAARLGIDGAELEWLVEFSLRMEEEPPRLGVSLNRRRRS
ncbi:MAG: hypothetical protein QI223_09050, partial [Candidatus Korarchaeota archaeon]|nr:hypothetical protein [Candidatus Korarchaeota archaeon]